VLASVVVALAAGWYGLLRRGGARLLGLGIALAGLIVAAVLPVSDARRWSCWPGSLDTPA
jgi:hypothetical protein